jgi:peptidoglycan/LPS O-acetylase OafA/YrhL
VSPNVVVAATLGNGVTAQAPPIAYGWPIAWFAFAIGGGLAGGLLKQLSDKQPRRWLAAIVVSVLVGFVAAGLYMLGVSTIPAIPVGIGGQLVVAVIAAVAALAGVSVLPVPNRR